MPRSVDTVNQSSEAASPEAVFDELHQLMHLYRAQRQRAFEAAGLEVSHLESKALGFFARNPGATLSDLVAHSGRDKSQLARLIGGLRERGLLEARPDEHDRRNLRLHATPRAEELHRSLRAQSRRLARVTLGDMPDDERARLVASLRRIAAALEKARG